MRRHTSVSKARRKNQAAEIRHLLSLKRTDFSSKSSLSGRRHIYIFRGRLGERASRNYAHFYTKTRGFFVRRSRNRRRHISIFQVRREDEMAEKPPSSFTKTCGFFVRIFTKRPTAYLYIPRPKRKPIGGNIPASLLKRADFSSGVLETGADIFLYFKPGERTK